MFPSLRFEREWPASKPRSRRERFGGSCAIAALETLLSEHEATKAKLAATDREYLNFTVLVHERLKKMAPEADGNTGKLFDYVEKKLAAYEAKEPAAAVPSDEEIVQAIRKADSTRTPYAVGHLTEAVEMLAKRIGVKL